MTDSLEPQPFARPAPPEESIGERIKQMRTGHKLSVDQLSALTVKFDHWRGKGVSTASIFRYEKVGPDGSLPGAREICLLCQALKVSPNWLLLGQDADDQAIRDKELAATARKLVTLVTDEERFPNSVTQWSDFEHAEKVKEVRERTSNESKSEK